MSLGPFDLTGGPFLTLYGILLALTIAAGALIPPWLRPEGHEGRVRDAESLAWLAGGPTRFADAVVARLVGAGALTIADKTEFRLSRACGPASGAEQRVLALPTPSRWRDLQPVLAEAAMPVERRLVAAGLVMDGGTILQMRFWQTLPYLLLIAFGSIKWEVGTMRDRPVGYLTGLLVITAVLAVVRFAAINRRTRAGNRVLAVARSQQDRLRRAPTAGETGLAVALFGTVVLIGSPWAAYHQMRASSSSDGGSGGDGGGGGGGGGCGGCGS